ncbi:hypothetical protein A4G19_06030 [Pasteurellaceae bacterium Macca]|nr:hypothetical protein [Pasteurellaceae bacterium Macca]
MNIRQITEQRYTVKAYDTERKISESDFAQIKSALKNSPSSVNVQPWHFIIADDEKGKARIAKSSFAFNTPKITDASHVVVFTTRIQADDDYLDIISEQEEKDGRFRSEEEKQEQSDKRKWFLNAQRNSGNEAPWLTRQVYLNIGFTTMAAAALGIDSTIMEGIDLATLDAEFDLPEKGYAAVAVVSFGYGKEDDFNAKLSKSRLAEELLFTQA